MNTFRHLLLASGHQPPIGTWISSASPLIAEAMGHAGFDWGVIDVDHAPADLAEVLQMLQAVSATKMVPVVRVPSNDATTVQRVLDAGACTLLFPFVHSADEARRAVAATRYPPEGVRGVAAVSRASKFGTAANYIRSANAGIGLIVQLHTPAAIAALESIAAVDGVDALFIAAADLSASMGFIGEFTHPQVLQAMAQAVRRARACAKPIGTLGSTPEHAAQYRAAGFDFIALGSDIGFLMRGAQAAVQALRTQDAGAVARVHTLQDGTQLDTAA